MLMRALVLGLGFLLAAGAAGRALEAGDDSPLKWHLSLAKAVAAAKKIDRPVVVVFWGRGSRAHDWFDGTSTISGRFQTADGWQNTKTVYPARRKVHKAKVVVAKIAPPTRLKVPAGATAEQVELFRKANKKIFDDYNAAIRKYGVARLPTVLFLSPDGGTVMKTYTRKPESTVLKGLAKIEATFDDYKRTREALKAVMEAEKKAKK